MQQAITTSEKKIPLCSHGYAQLPKLCVYYHKVEFSLSVMVEDLMWKQPFCLQPL